MPVDEIDVFLRRQLGVLNEHPGRDVAATEEEFFDVLGQFIASNPDFRVKVDGHETSFVLSGVIKERVKSFFSPSSPLHVSR